MATTLVAQPVLATAPTSSARTLDRERTVNILLTSFAGLGLPRTLSLPVQASASLHDVLSTILSRLPRIDHPLIITTTSNKQLLPSNQDAISSLLSHKHDTILPLRLSVRLCGGKGGFGSQLRAAGGRMSSRKSRNQQNQNPNGSNRNLDGRRLRTVDEAKRLAEYLAIKPEMEQREKEERQKRWETVVEAAEKREEEIKSGRAEKGRLDADYVESKELAEERTREAVMKAMRKGMLGGERTGSESSMDAEGGEESGDSSGEESSGSSREVNPEKEEDAGRTFFGWDDDEDEDEDGEDEEEDGDTNEPQTTYEGKGKGKAL